MTNSFIWPIDRTLPGATNLGQSGPGNNGNKRVLRKAPALLDHLHVYWHMFSIISRIFVGEYYLSAEMQSVYSTTPVDWASKTKWDLHREKPNVIKQSNKKTQNDGKVGWKKSIIYNWFDFFVEWQFTLRGLFNAKDILVEEQ